MTPLQKAAMEQALKALEAMTAKGRIPPTAKAFHSAAYAIIVLRQTLADEQQAEPFNTWSSNDGDSWYDDPADAQILNDVFGGDIPVVGDEYEVLAGWRCVTARYRIAFVSGDGDCEVDCISHPCQQPAQQLDMVQVAAIVDENQWLRAELKFNTQPAQTAIPPGYKLVPLVPTPEMLDAATIACDDRMYPADMYHGPRPEIADRHIAMLSAAPEAPAQQPLTDEEIDACFPVQWEGEFYKPWRKAVARAIERAHRIGGGA